MMFWLCPRQTRWSGDRIFDILQTFCGVSGICINSSKTTVHFWGLEDQELTQLKAILPFTFSDLNSGFKYLGYHLKPEASKAEDWGWLVAKIEKKIGLWCNQWLSIGGRLILVKSVLESQSVFWMSMELILKSVLNRIRQSMFEFLWSGQKAKHHRIHLCRWDLLARPKRCGGWGLRNLTMFNTALLANSFWRALMVDNIWHKILVDKYLGEFSVVDWLRKTAHNQQKVSSFWSGMTKSIYVILHWLRWSPVSGNSVLFRQGLNSWSGE
jgi:hypothetical protein